MRKVEVLERIDKFQRALNRLKEAVQRVEDELDRDGVIWKCRFGRETLKV
jgi:hypothetical protein